MIGLLDTLIGIAVWAIYLLVLARVVLSWLPVAGVRVPSYHPAVIFVKQTTEPLLRPFRRLLPPRMTASIDLSPVLLFVVVGIARQILFAALHGF